MQQHLTNYYGIRQFEKNSNKFLKKIQPNKICMRKQTKHKKKKKQSIKNPLVITSKSQKSLPEKQLIFLRKYRLIENRNSTHGLFSGHKTQISNTTPKHRFTRKVSYGKNTTSQIKKQKFNKFYRKFSSTNLQLNNKNQRSLTFTLSKKRPQKQALTLDICRTSFKPSQHSFSTRPVSVSQKRFKSNHNIKDYNCSSLQYFSQQVDNGFKQQDCITNRIQLTQKKPLLHQAIQKQIIQQPQSHLCSAENSSSAKISLYSSKSKIRSIMLLPLESMSRKNNSRVTIKNLNSQLLSEFEGYIFIEESLERINILAQYSQQIITKYEDISDWDELVFLVYKKYYLQRKKIARALLYGQTKYFSDFLKTPKDRRKLQTFIRNYECQKIVQDLVFQNLTIEQSLRNLYNLIIEKSGDYINLHELDNFTMQIFKLLLEEISILKSIYELDRKQVADRLKNILKCANVLAYIDKLQFRYRLNNLTQQILNLKLVTFGSTFEKVQNFFRIQIYN